MTAQLFALELSSVRAWLVNRWIGAGVIAYLLAASATAATFTVTSTGDAPDANTADGVCQTSGGACTLRAAIEQANASAGADVIGFQFCPPGAVGSCAATIQPTTPLPDLAGNLTIDGFTEPASQPNSLEIGLDVVHSVFINFESLPAPSSPDQAGLRITGDGVTLRGLVLYDADNLDPQARTGVLIRADRNSISGCFIGTADGFQGAGFREGIRVEGSFNDIGLGTLAGRNLITGNAAHVVIERGSGNRPSDNIVVNNYIGTDTSGNGPLPRPTGAAGIGVRIREADDNRVGGGVLAIPDDPASRNVFLTPGRNAIVIDGGRRNIVQRNYLGLGASGGVSPLIGEPTPLGASILIAQLAGTATSADDNLIGGPTAVEGNTITRGVSAGVRIGASGTDASSGNRVLSNRIVRNNFLGISLADIGANDPGDADTGPNGFQNSPEIVNFIRDAQPNAGAVEVRLQSTPRMRFTLQVFANWGMCIPDSDFEGDVLLATESSVFTETSDSGELVTRLNVTLPDDPQQGGVAGVLTATATDANGNTSQFSRCFDAASETAGTFVMQDARIAGLEGDIVEITVRREGGTNGSASVGVATQDITANAGGDYGGFSTRIDFADGQSQRLVSVSLLRDNEIDPNQTFRAVLSNPTGAALDPARSETIVEIVDAESRFLSVTDDSDGSDLTTLGIDFGEILRDTTASRRVRVQNVTSLVLGITALDITGATDAVGIANSGCGSLAPNASCTFDVVFAPVSVGAFTAGVAIRYSPTVGREESFTVRGSASIQSDLRVFKSASGAAARPGDAVTYQLGLSNTGAATANGVVVTDVLSDSVSDPVDPTTGSSALQPTAGTAQYDPATRTITWSAGDLAQFASVTLRYRVTIAANATGTLRNTANITAGSANDRNSADNAHSADVQIVAQAADLAVDVQTQSVSLPVNSVPPGQDWDETDWRTIELGIVNRGPDPTPARLTIQGYTLLRLVDLTVQPGGAGPEQPPFACTPAMPTHRIRGWLDDEANHGALPAEAQCELISGALAPGDGLVVRVTILAVGGAGTSAQIDFSLSGDAPDPVPSNNADRFGVRVLIPLDPTSFGSGSSGIRCFIATAAYGSYLEPEVVVLRRFRDRWLLTNAPGRAFVEWYYRNSPPIAAYIAERPVLRAIVRSLLTPIVYTIKYPWPAAALTFAMLFGLGAWLPRRRQLRPQDSLFTSA
jgi:uncharacterized repeat protein (TIGR01451 family)/CSLREA domain-containing protein